MKGLLGFLFLSMPVILAGGWLVLTWLLAKGALRLLGSSFVNRTVRVVLIVAVMVVWFGGAFWEVVGKKMYWDAKVRELCAKDGGIKVYETVVLPVEKFDKYGNVQIPSENEAGPQDSYFYKREIKPLRKGDPNITRTRYLIIRQSDGKVLGESVHYSRGGGDLPGPWHPSSYICPPISKDRVGIEKQVFKKGV